MRPRSSIGVPCSASTASIIRRSATRSIAPEPKRGCSGSQDSPLGFCGRGTRRYRPRRPARRAPGQPPPAGPGRRARPRGCVVALRTPGAGLGARPARRLDHRRAGRRRLAQRRDGRPLRLGRRRRGRRRRQALRGKRINGLFAGRGRNPTPKPVPARRRGPSTPVQEARTLVARESSPRPSVPRPPGPRSPKDRLVVGRHM